MNLTQTLDPYFRKGDEDIMIKVKNALKEHLGDLSELTPQQIRNWPLDKIVYQLGVHLDIDLDDLNDGNRNQQIQYLLKIVRTIIVFSAKKLEEDDPYMALEFISNTSDAFEVSSYIHPQLKLITNEIDFESLIKQFTPSEKCSIADQSEAYLKWNGTKPQLDRLVNLVKGDYALVKQVPPLRAFLQGDNTHWILVNEMKIYQFIILIEKLRKKGWISLRGGNGLHQLLSQILTKDGREVIAKSGRYFSDLKYRVSKNSIEANRINEEVEDIIENLGSLS